MPQIIFHQYAMSPFSEKIRKVFALKNLEYREVDQPAWMPKPHLTPMTGGYRRIPVLQIGADIYCDSALIARTIEKHHPTPSIHPGGNIVAAEAAAMWSDKTLFFSTVALVFTAMAEVIPPALFEDRRKMFPQMNIEVLKQMVPTSRGSLTAACSMSMRRSQSTSTYSATSSAWPMRPSTTRSGSCAAIRCLRRRSTRGRTSPSGSPVWKVWVPGNRSP